MKEPRALELPDRDTLDYLVRHLNETARREFLNELLDALITAKDKNDLRPVQDLIQLWEAEVANPTSQTASHGKAPLDLAQAI